MLMYQYAKGEYHCWWNLLRYMLTQCTCSSPDLIAINRLHLWYKRRPSPIAVISSVCAVAIVPVPVDGTGPANIYAGRGCASAPGSSSRCLFVIHSRINVLLIFVFFNNSASSLSNATSLAEITSITNVSRAGNPSSLRFLSTVHEL